MFDGGGGGGGGAGKWVGPSRSAQVKALKESVKTGHLTGMPDQLLRMFEPRDRPPYSKPRPKKAPKLPYTGVAQYLNSFAEPGDPEYEPPRAADRPPSPRKFRNKELELQVRLDKETKAEKCVAPRAGCARSLPARLPHVLRALACSMRCPGTHPAHAPACNWPLPMLKQTLNPLLPQHIQPAGTRGSPRGASRRRRKPPRSAPPHGTQIKTP